MRQYFGEEVVCDKIKYTNKTSYTYRLGTCVGFIGMDMYNFFTRKMISGMHYITSEPHHILKTNTTLYRLDDVDMSTKFNNCTIIFYYTDKYDPTTNELSKMEAQEQFKLINSAFEFLRT